MPTGPAPGATSPQRQPFLPHTSPPFSYRRLHNHTVILAEDCPHGKVFLPSSGNSLYDHCNSNMLTSARRFSRVTQDPTLSYSQDTLTHICYLKNNNKKSYLCNTRFYCKHLHIIKLAIVFLNSCLNRHLQETTKETNCPSSSGEKDAGISMSLPTHTASPVLMSQYETKLATLKMHRIQGSDS